MHTTSTKTTILLLIFCWLSSWAHAQSRQALGSGMSARAWAGTGRYAGITLGAARTPMAAYSDNIEEADTYKAPGKRVAAQLLAITTQPEAVTIQGGETASFTVVAAGQGTLTYQWQLSQDGGASFSNINNGLVYTGATTPALTLTKVPVSMNGYQYRVQVSNGTVVTSYAVPLTVQVPPFDNSRVWQVAGTPGFSAGQAAFTSLTLDKSGNPYVAYSDLANGEKVTVMKQVGWNWETVGPAAFSAGRAWETSLALDADNTPFVAYKDLTNGNKATVKKFDGSAWVGVGPAGFSASWADFISLALDAAGNPYVAFKDAANGGKATVMRYTGSSWITVGAPGISAGLAHYVSLAFDSQGNPFIAYMDYGNAYKVTVMRYTGTSWVAVGTAGFSAGEANYIDLVLDANDTPFVVFLDRANDFKATVMQYTGSGWVAVGGAGFSAGPAHVTSLALDAAGVPYVAYRDEVNGFKATVMRYTGTGWLAVGSAGFSAGQAAAPILALDAAGTPFVVLGDMENQNKASVMKFATPPPTLTTQPAAATITGGESASFTVSAAGPGTLTYQWQVSQDGGASFSDIPNGQVYGGAATPTLTLANVPISMDGYRYRVQVGHESVTTSAAVSLTVNVPAFDNTRVWQVAGVAGFSAGGAENTSLVMDALDNPFLAYRDMANGGKVTVRKFIGSSWEDVGAAGFSAGYAGFTSLALDASGTPYVAYQDYGNGYKATVRKFTGSSWVDVGTAGLSAGMAYFTSIVLEGSDSPLVAYADGTNGNKVTVKKFTGSSWQDVGTTGFSDGGATFISIALDANDTPFVAYVDEANGSKMTVKKFTGSSWEDVGIPGFSAGQASYASLALDASGTPYVAYQDEANGKKVTVKKFTGSSWIAVGSAGFSVEQADFTRLALDASGTPFVAYKDWGNDYKAIVKKFTGSSWVAVGSAGPSPGVAFDISFALDASGTPFVAYQDGVNSSKTTVMKFAPTPLTLTMQPVASTINGGEHTSFKVAATGPGAITYQWQVSQDAGASFSNIQNGQVYGGATTPTLALTQVPISMNEYQYRVQVSSGIVATSHAAALTVQVPGFDNTRVWQALGTDISGQASAGPAFYTSIALDATGTPFVAYQDVTNGMKATVRKHAGGSWADVGSAGLSAGTASSISIALDAAGTPFVAYHDGSQSGKATVRKYDGSTWVDVGPAGFSAGQIYDPSLAVDANGTPFLVYIDGANSDKVTVKKFTGNSWVTVGAEGISAGGAYFTSIAFDADNTPFVAFRDQANGFKITVMKYTGNSWVAVGSAGLSSGEAAWISVALDAAGTPFVAYQDVANGGKATLKRYTGSSWVDFGTPGISAGQAPHTSLLLDASGTPYVAYRDETHGSKATVMKYTGSSWIAVGGAGFSAGATTYTSLAMGADGTPYVTYQDEANGGKATVMKFAAPPVTAPAATITTGILAATTYCAGSPLPVPFSTTGTFGAQNTFTAQLSDAAGSFAQPTTIGSGTASPLAAIIPAHVVPGTGYRIRVVAAAPLVTAADNGSDVTIKTLAGQPGTISGAAAVCPGQTGIRYSINPVPGITAYSWTVPEGWQITAGQGTTAITLTAGSAGGQIAVTADNACGQSAASTLAVSFLPVVEDNAIAADQAICLGAAAGLLTGSTPTGGNGALAYLWESSTASATQGFAPAPGTNTGKDYMPGGGILATTWFRRKVLAADCPATATYSNAIKITVLAPPAMPTAAPVSQCGTGPVTLTATGEESDTSFRWYTTAAGGTAIVGETGAVFTSPTLTATTTYYVAAVNPAGCESDRRAVTATIHPLPQVVAGADSSVCADAAEFFLTGFGPAGGSWLGPGVSPAGVFSPAAAGPGIHTLIYSVTENGCAVSAIRTITVKEAPTLSLPVFTDICSSKTSLALTGGEPAGGTWSGPGVSEGIFNAALAGVGTHALTYSYTDASGCRASASRDITVTACTGIADEAEASDWSLYPNPTSGKIRVELSVKVRTDLVFRILRADGSLVMEKAFPRVSGAFTQVFDMGGSAKGLYLLQQLSDQGMLTKQFVLQ